MWRGCRHLSIPISVGFTKKCFLALLLIALSLPLTSYVTVPSSTYNVKVGDELNLFVPDVPVGYVDKALWGCDSPYLHFKEKDEVWAVVEVLPGFTDAATITLYYTEKYLTADSKTRANTYYKEFRIIASGGSSTSPRRIVVQSPIDLHAGESADFPITFEPEGSSANVSCGQPDKKGVASAFIYKFKTLRVHAGHQEGSTKVALSTDNNVKATVTINVLPPKFPDIETDGGEVVSDRALKKAVQRIETLTNTCINYKQ